MAADAGDKLHTLAPHRVIALASQPPEISHSLPPHPYASPARLSQARFGIARRLYAAAVSAASGWLLAGLPWQTAAAGLLELALLDVALVTTTVWVGRGCGLGRWSVGFDCVSH
jgi:hypothetical protein